MADDSLTPADAAQEFWKHLRDSATVMLGINDPDQHTQPMAAFAEPDSNTIWFFTRDDSDLAREARPGKDGRLVLVSRNREVYADIRGTLDCLRDRKRIDRYWGPTVAAWYPLGKDDPHLILLRFTPEEGQVWMSTKGLARLASWSLAFDVGKAGVTHAPQAGGATDVSFRH